jgi:protein phosphatase
MDDVTVSVFAQTDVGMQRSGNEDAFLVADLSTGNVGLGDAASAHPIGERGALLIVSDGMGGAAHGEIASEMTVSTIFDTLLSEPGDGEVTERLRTATETANQQIWDRAQENMDFTGMGATVTAALVQGTSIYIAQVGDSRAYLLRSSRIKQLTKDQSWAQMLFDSGAVNLEQMAALPQNVIMQALGTQPEVKVAMSAIQLFRNDCLILCSDGLSNKVSPDELSEIVQAAPDLTEACRLLIERANARGGEDNITVVIARFDGDGLKAAGDGNSITASFKPITQDYFDPDAIAQYRASREEKSRTVTSPSEDDSTDPDFTPNVDSSTGVTQTFNELQFELREPPSSPVIRRGFLVIIIVGLVSMILLLATAYFFYENYLKDHPRELPQQNTPSSPQG